MSRLKAAPTDQVKNPPNPPLEKKGGNYMRLLKNLPLFERGI
jgi:hypothetical protein